MKKTEEQKIFDFNQKVQHYANIISPDELKEYYILHTKAATKEHFSISSVKVLEGLLSYFNITKTKEDIKRTKENTNLERYGFKNPFENTEKIKKSVKSKYGVDNVSKAEEVKHKINQTKLDNNSYVIAAEKNKQTRQFNAGSLQESYRKALAKQKQSLIKKYGSLENAYKQQKSTREQTCLSKYGHKNVFSSDTVKDKIKQTNRERYNSDYPLQNKDIIAKAISNTDFDKRTASFRKTCLDRYGVDNPNKLDWVREKIENTNIANIGVPYHCMLKDNKAHGSNSKPNNNFAELLDLASISYEREFALDKYVYDFKIGNILVEINPTATHNSTWGIYDKPLDKDYHYNKSQVADKHGFQCIHVFDWDDTNKVVNLLVRRQTYYARKCVIKEVPKKESVVFLDKYHLQGNAKDSIRLGLYANNELVSLMTFGKPRYNKKYEYELIRYCSIANIVGGPEKLFKHFIEQYKPASIVSYCDKSKFTGKVYNQLGFTLLANNKPSKHWYNDKTKIHITDNFLRQRGYDQIFNTNYGKGTSNEELMLLNNFVEIYDCGQATYEYKLSN